MLRTWSRITRRHIAWQPCLRNSGSWPTCVRSFLPVPTRDASTFTSLESYPAVGEKIHGFTIQQKKHVPELHLTAILLRHDKTDADYLHVARDDKNNVFNIAFKTNPPDATGVPHILEHTTLCGSEKYPIRDPFFKMLPRSLSNFMNAFTSSDHTSYPFATTNQQDFRNLLSVYLDATLHPLLKEEDFRQEGWRLGLEDPRDNGSNILFKGVVYNEMKGQMSDANYLYWIRFKEHIFPAINNSGGDPEKITDLTHGELVEFSRTNYHPSNAKIFTYGDIPLNEYLRQVGSVLDEFPKVPADHKNFLPRNLISGGAEFTLPGPLDRFASEDRQFKTSISWLAGDITDITETFSLGIISSLLLDGYGSPMYQALIETGMGSSFSPNTGLDTSGRIPIFSVGINGATEKDVSLTKERIQHVFREIRTSGFDDDKVQGILHQLELALRHKTANFGIGIMEKIITPWFNGSDPMKEIAWNEILNGFKTRYNQGHYLETLLEKYFMNDNCLTFTMFGSPTYNEDLNAAEKARLDFKLSELASELGSMELATSHLQNAERDLLRIQETAQNADLSCLPTLHVKDISRQKEWKPVRESIVGGTQVVWREVPTNGLTYFQTMNIIEGLPNELRLLLPLYSDCIMRLGTDSRNMGNWEDLIKLKTGGITSSPFVVSSPMALDRFSEGIQYSGYSLNQNFSEMLDILTSLSTETNFSSANAPGMVLELLRSATNGALDNVAAAGNRFAVNAAASAISKKFWVQEQYSGLSQIQATAQLLSDAEISPDRLQDLIQKLQMIQTFAISRSAGFRVRLVCEREGVTKNEAALLKWLDRLPHDVGPPPAVDAMDYVSRPTMVFYDLPFKVSYSGVACRTVPFTDPASASLGVLSQLLTHKYLHPEIREKGGAYGSSANSSPLQGCFSLSSYRDPNPENSLKTFDNCGVFARDRPWTERELEEAKLGIFQSLDAPMAVDEEGQRYFMSGITHEMDQRWREQVLDVSASDVNDVAEKFLVNTAAPARCILGEATAFPVRNGWQVRKPSLGPVDEIPSEEIAQQAVGGRP